MTGLQLATRVANLERLVESYRCWLDNDAVHQAHPGTTHVCAVSELQRYFLVTTASADGDEVWCTTHATRDGLRAAIEKALLGEYQWYPEQVLDLDTGRDLAWDLTIHFADDADTH